MINQFVEALRKKIREDMNNYADDVATGACRTIEEYKFLCGQIQGLALAERYMLDLAKLVEESE